MKKSFILCDNFNFIFSAAKVKMISSQAMDITNKSKTVLEDNKMLIKEYYANEKEARELMSKGHKEHKTANRTFEEANSAYEKAKAAKKTADDTAKEAIETLRLLTVRFTAFKQSDLILKIFKISSNCLL